MGLESLPLDLTGIEFKLWLSFFVQRRASRTVLGLRLAFLVDIDVPELLEPEAVRLPRVGIK